MRFNLFILNAILYSMAFFASGQSVPEVGAQVYIEPGQTKEQIDNWFAILDRNDMRVARLFMMWEYMEPAKNKWDFTLYDWAFDAAQKHNIKVVATLMANHGPSCRGFYYSPQNGAIPRTREWLEESAIGIKEVVNHYKNHKALDHWMLMNEPGQWPADDPLAIENFREYLKNKYVTVAALNKAWLTGVESFEKVEYDKKWDAAGGFSWPVAYFDWNYFWREHMTRYMAWVAAEIRKSDNKTPLHVNPHGLLDIYHTYELPKWREFLSSIGASIHPVWHFGLLKREQYDFGVSFVSEMMKGVSTPHPFWITELQGGNNGYSGAYPLTPGYAETSRWIWSGIGSGAQRVVFWCLNYRMQGGEAAEWSMLNFDDSPSPRLKAAADAAKVIRDHKSFFEKAVPEAPKAVILLSPESGFVARHKAAGEDDHERSRTAHTKEALGVAMALSGRGIPYTIKMTDDLEKEKPQPGMLYILPHAISLTESQMQRITALVRDNGAELLMTGLTGAYDEYEKSRFLYDKNPFSKIAGVKVLSIDEFGEKDTLKIGNTALPFIRWASSMKITGAGAEIIAYKNNLPAAITVKVGKGKVTWVPATVGMGAWLYGPESLSDFITQKFDVIKNYNYKNSFNPNLQIKRMTSGKNEIAIMTNSGKEIIEIKDFAGAKATWYSSDSGSSNSNILLPGEIKIVQIK